MALPFLGMYFLVLDQRWHIEYGLAHWRTLVSGGCLLLLLAILLPLCGLIFFDAKAIEEPIEKSNENY
jgi:hypothetical protein